ncbi:MAG: TIGR00269 family protein [Nanoarchaeota archaeon]
MACKKCGPDPVMRLSSGVKLCRSCFIKYFEKKVRKTLRIFSLIEAKERIAVAVSGGKDSISVLSILNDIASKKKHFQLFAILIDEGISGYREHTIATAKSFCEERNIPLHVYSFKKEFGYTLDEMVKKLGMKPCTICGVFRRYLLNRAARELKADKLVTGHNMDDEAQSVLMNQFKSNIGLSARLGPITGVKTDRRFVRRIKPLYMVSEKEVALYALLKNLRGKHNECTYENLSFRGEIRDMLNYLEDKHHGVKNNVINSYLEIMPVLKEKYKTEDQINSCLKCNEPTSGDVCAACELLAKLK